jgi:hypothetical protein
MNSRALTYMMVILLLISGQSAGCSIIGYIGGHIYDDLNAVEDLRHLQRIKRVKQRTVIEITLNDGTKYKGKYMGLIYSEGKDEHTAMILTDYGDILEIPVNSIIWVVEFKSKRDTFAREYGFGVGLLVDIIVLTYLASKYRGINSLRNWN